ncbi:MAG: hypothetical protein NZ772_07420, partial [Cyanobacteria bacterium]|nr:hypothetical protein [Cyanobacteriota bacterium]MDW8202010.1 hypothetical protein [Cyanobacteriota bacterium SKYGB_h_bin112]
GGVPTPQMATANTQSSQPTVGDTARPTAIAASNQASQQLSKLVDDWEHEHHSASENDTEALSELIQQLSQPGLQESEPVEHDVRSENLLPEDATVLKSRSGESSVQPLPHVIASVGVPMEGQGVVNRQGSLDESTSKATARESTPEPMTTSKLMVSTTPTKTEAIPRNRAGNIALGLLGGIAIGGGIVWGLWTLAQWRPQSSQTLPNSPVLTQPLTGDRVNLKAIRTPNLMAIAITRFNQGDLTAGGQAMEELLDRVALKEAAEVLAAVPTNQTGDAYISFLRGRLAWQYLQQPENVPYSLDDVRRSWETAVRQDPKSALYRNALGFAYYAEGRLPAAQEQWSTAIELATSKTSPSQSVVAKNADALTASAGIALAFAAAAEGKPPAEREQLLAQAVKGYQAVIAQDPINFQQQALGQNWLWTEEAIRQWVVLGKQQ